jgi:O-antigen ligase
VNINVLITFICFILSGFFHQGLYIFFPALTFLYVIYQKESKIYINPISKIYLYFVIVAVVFFALQSIFYQDIKIFSIKGCLRYTAYFSFAVFASYLSQNNIKYLFVMFLVYFILTLPMSYFQIVNFERYKNIIGHSNHLAYVLSMLIYFLVFHRPFKNKIINISCIILLFISLILTKSSGGLLVILALLAYNGLMSKRISLINKVLFLSLPIVVFFLAINLSEKIAFQFESLNFLNWNFIQDRATQFSVDGVVRAGGYGSFIWRIIYWSAIVYEFLTESILKIMFGLGVDHLTQGNMPYKFMSQDPHNDFVKALLEFGVLGFLLFTSYFWRIYKVLRKNFNVIILMIIPAFFGNPVVNFSVSIVYILILMYEYKKVDFKVS